MAIVWLLPIAFTATSMGSSRMVTAYILSETAGKIGTLLIVIFTALVFTRRLNSDKAIAKTFIKSAAAMFIFIGVFAFINEHGTKKLLKLSRPSHQYIHEKCGDDMLLTVLYGYDSEGRSHYLKQAIEKHRTMFKGIDAWVLDHWSDEGGYSFPSGHSFNAFLLACILSFSMLHSRSRRVSIFYMSPWIWAAAVAVSRVALGVHTALDVTAGAVMGTAFGLTFLSWDDARNLMTHRKHNI